MPVVAVLRRSNPLIKQLTASSTLILIAFTSLVLLVGSASAQTFTVRYAFNGGQDGSLSQPYANLALDAAGNLYGTTSGFSCLRGCNDAPGAIFRLSSLGKLTVVHTLNCETAGCSPLGGLVGDSGGNVYGTTQNGDFTWGTVYQVNATTYETLHAFNHTDGSAPASDLLRDAVGNLYGTAPSGGDLNSGVAFEISSAGEFNVLHRFSGGLDGSFPSGGLVMDAQGNLYGTTGGGGGSGCLGQLGCGTVYKIDTSGQETVLYSFAGGTDGSAPNGDLLLDKSGNLYGTTAGGGGSGCQGNGCGTVFKVDKNGVETVLYRFKGGNDAANPGAGLVTDGAGNLYGTTVRGGAKDFGTVFGLRPNGKEVILHRFTGGTDGANPVAKLLRDSHGTLYGTTRSGGNVQCPYAIEFVPGCGVVFSISLP